MRFLTGGSGKRGASAAVEAVLYGCRHPFGGREGVWVSSGVPSV